MRIYMKSKRGLFDASGTYNDGKVIVKKGSLIKLKYSDKLKRASTVIKYTDDRSCVDKDGIVLKDCCFTSPSTAAQFVSGRSCNGYICWHIDGKTTLQKWLQKK